MPAVAQRWPERTIEERFVEKLELDEETGCLLWTGYTDPAGYGRFFVGSDEKAQLAHRVAYKLFVGPIPAGMTLDHACHTGDVTCAGGSSCQHRRCVNLDHLEVVTLAENMARGRSLPAQNARKTHCDSGHEYTSENTRISPDGYRQCRACGRARARELAASKVAERAPRICEAPGCANLIEPSERPDKHTCSPACRTRRGRALRAAA